jgi:hypothetical protein
MKKAEKIVRAVPFKIKYTGEGETSLISEMCQNTFIHYLFMSIFVYL